MPPDCMSAASSSCGPMVTSRGAGTHARPIPFPSSTTSAGPEREIRMRVNPRHAAALLLASFVCLLGPRSGQADDAAAFYRGKTVRIIIGVGSGGGYDAYAHMLAPHLAKGLGANVVVESIPGAGQLVAIN